MVCLPLSIAIDDKDRTRVFADSVARSKWKGYGITRRALLMASVAAGVEPQMAAAQSVAQIVVPYPPGGTTDVTARLIAPRASLELGQAWLIDNRSGANGTIGAKIVALSKPDGQALLYSNEVLIVLHFVQRDLPLDPLIELTPIMRAFSIPYVLVGASEHATHSDVNALLVALRATPDQFRFASSTLGSVGQFAAAALGQKLGTMPLIVAYRGTAPAVQDLLAGSVELMFAPLGAVAPLIQDRKLIVFAATSEQRLALLPEVPTLAELGFTDMVFEGWTGLWGPRDLSDGIVARIHTAVTAAAEDSDVQRRLKELGCIPVRESTPQFAELIQHEHTRAAALVSAMGITPQ